MIRRALVTPAASPAAGLALVLALAAASPGCAAPQAQLPADVLQRMQAEARTAIYDRENDLSIARNRLDEAESQRAAVLRQRQHLDDSARRLRERFGKSGAGGAARAQKLERPVAAHRGYLDAQLRQLGARHDVAEAQAYAAHARLQQTRQLELVRTGRALARSMEPFDKAVQERDEDVRAAERREGDRRIETEKAYQQWKAAEDEYAAATGDWDTSVWTD